MRGSSLAFLVPSGAFVRVVNNMKNNLRNFCILNF